LSLLSLFTKKYRGGLKTFNQLLDNTVDIEQVMVTFLEDAIHDENEKASSQ